MKFLRLKKNCKDFTNEMIEEILKWKKLKEVNVNFMTGKDNRNYLISNVKRVNITEDYLEISFGDSEIFVLKLENLVFYSIK